MPVTVLLGRMIISAVSCRVAVIVMVCRMAGVVMVPVPDSGEDRPRHGRGGAEVEQDAATDLAAVKVGGLRVGGHRHQVTRSFRHLDPSLGGESFPRLANEYPLEPMRGKAARASRGQVVVEIARHDENRVASG